MSNLKSFEIKSETSDDNHFRTNLIINYLPQTLTDHEFKRIFERIGPVVSAKIIRNKHNNYSYGFGFVEYRNSEHAQKAIDTLNGHQLSNKKIKVAYSRPHSDDIKRAKLYVKNIPNNFSVDQLNQWFGEYGTIIQCRLLEDNNSTSNAKNKGVAFILYDLHEQAEKAIENLNGVTLPGASQGLDIKFASASGIKHENPIMKQMRQPNRQNNYNGNNSRQRNNYHNNATMNPHPNTNYYDNGMPYNNMDNYNNFKYPNHNSGNNLYGGPIRNNFQYGNKSHHTNRYNPINNPSASQPMDYSEAYSYESPTSNDYGYGGNKNYQQNNYHPNYNAPSNPKNNGNGSQDQSGYILFVYNIGLNTDEQMLRNLFTKFGHVLRSNVIRKGNESKGFGFVAMSTHRDAMNAIQALNGYSYNGKQLQVSFKK